MDDSDVAGDTIVSAVAGAEVEATGSATVVGASSADGAASSLPHADEVKSTIGIDAVANFFTKGGMWISSG